MSIINICLGGKIMGNDWNDPWGDKIWDNEEWIKFVTEEFEKYLTNLVVQDYHEDRKRNERDLRQLVSFAIKKAKTL